MPYSYPTTPGVTYAVECAAEVFVTNPQTGAVAVSGDGSATVYFTATDTLYDISDDSAKVQPLFKLAPRLTLALLQGVAGGWLPKGFTLLEYLESSGTQFIDTGVLLDTSCGVNVTAANTALNNNADGICIYGAQVNAETLRFRMTIYCEPIVSQNVAWVGIGDFNSMVYDKNVDTSIMHTYFLNNEEFAFDGVALFETNATPFENTSRTSYLFALNAETVYHFIGRIASAVFYKNGSKVRDFIPVLRNADGVPGMFDRVSKQFFANDGTGTFGYRIKRTGEEVALMARRDPWRVAPSGVYARSAGENELEIVADTEETTGEGWEWFANTAEAYAHFGIVPQEEFLTE